MATPNRSLRAGGLCIGSNTNSPARSLVLGKPVPAMRNIGAQDPQAEA
jgi:hypothetical protein